MLKESRKIKSNNNLFKYYIYYPRTIKENMPVLVYLHGIGERGNKLYHKDNFWDYHLRDIEKVIEREYKKFKFDKKNIFILGSSMGAYGAWNYLIQRPQLFKGIVSVAGGIMLPIEQNLQIIKNKPILMYHGDKDDVVDVSESINIYNKLRNIGANNIELKIIKNDNHFLSSHAFKDNYIYEWLDKNIEGVFRNESSKYR